MVWRSCPPCRPAQAATPGVSQDGASPPVSLPSRLSIRLGPPRGSHWSPSAGRQGPGHPDSAPAGWGAPPTASPPRGVQGPSASPSVLLVFGKRMWASRPAGEYSGSGFSPDNAGGHRAGTTVGAARGSLVRGRLAGVGLGPGHGVEVDTGLRLHHDRRGTRGHEAHVGAVGRPDLSEVPVSVGVQQLLAGQPACGRWLGCSAGREGLRLPGLRLRGLAGPRFHTRVRPKQAHQLPRSAGLPSGPVAAPSVAGSASLRGASHEARGLASQGLHVGQGSRELLGSGGPPRVSASSPRAVR